MRYSQRFLSLILALSMLLASFSVGLQEALGYDPETFYVDRITLGKNFDSDRNPVSMNLSIWGKDIRSAQVFIEKENGQVIRLANPKETSDGLLYFEFTKIEEMNQLSGILSITVGSARIPIGGKDAMPAITYVTPKVNQERDTLVIRGTNLNKIKDDSDEFEVKYGNGVIYSFIDDDKFGSDEVQIEKPQGELGLQDIIINRSFNTPKVKFNHAYEMEVSMNINYNYIGQFRLVTDLNIGDDIEMYPNRGVKGSKVYFKSEKLGDYDVYFLKATDGTDPYTEANRGKNPVLGTVDDKQQLTVEVPDLPPGEYIPVITSRVSSGQDPDRHITGEYIYKKENFTVIQGTRSATIGSIQPNTGPDTGSDATIYGRYLGSLNIDDLFTTDGSLEKPVANTVHDENGKPVFDDRGNPILDHLDYGIWRYRGANYHVTKEIKVYVGGQATVKPTSIFNPTFDTLHIRVPDNTDGELVKDVVVETDTLLIDNDGNIAYKFSERVELPRGYTIIPSSVTPEVTGVVPNQIFVRKIAEGKYILPHSVLLGIYGRNFTTYNVDGTQVKPQVHFEGATLKIGDILVLDNSGSILDGTPGSEEGTKLLVTLPSENNQIQISDDLIGVKIPVTVKNPVRNSLEPGFPSEGNVLVQFIEIQEENSPVIESVTPDVVTVEGGEQVVIRGSNFRADVKVIIDGQEISNIQRTGDGSTITFTAPPGREGDTQLQVLNPDGGMAVWNFKYVSTYTDPKLIDFSPKAGNTKTIVLVTGDNFLTPDPTATKMDVDRLIGTKIFLGGRDINEYNLDDYKKPKLENFISRPGEEIIRINDDGVIELADYWHSILLTDDNKFFTLRPDSRGVPILTDGVQETYRIILKDGDLIASRVGGSDETLKVADTGLIIGDKELTMQTPYKMSGNEEDGYCIVGNHVKVLDKNRILFTVPILTEGWYEVAVVNPDTKRDVAADRFYYYESIDSQPKIERVEPDKGSTDGGYFIDIIGEDFKSSDDLYSRVFINGIEVPREDTTVSIGGDRITVKVPPYPGDLRAELGTDRLAVPVVVLNPDGASASREDGFTYMVPTSHPEITRIVPPQGSAAGGEIVEIFGKDFRYFEPFNDDDRDGQRDDDELYTDVNINYEWDDYRKNAIRKLRGDKYNSYLGNVGNLKEYFKEKYGEDEVEEKFRSIVTPVLPKVYFGGRLAEIVEYDDGYLKVITPPGVEGPVEVYIVNNDSGISNKVQYQYQASRPVITRIVPPEGRKQGGDRVEIFGQSFIPGKIPVYGEYGRDLDILMRFGNISNHDIPRDQENSGRIDHGRTTVRLPGWLTVEYANGQFQVSISEQGFTYTSGPLPFTLDPDNPDPDFTGPMYFPTSLLKYGEGENEQPYPGDELIRLEIRDRRLLVERGYAPSAVVLNPGQLLVTTPSYYTIGRVEVTVINPDGGRAQGVFEYKNPQSQPHIIDITKETQPPLVEEINGEEVKVQKVTYKGGNVISVIGSDFRENASIQIGDVLTLGPGDITYNLPTKLTFTMPSVPESAVGKLHRVVVINEDGGFASSDETKPLPIYIMFIKGETAPEITKITPDVGPAGGGTSVTIEGKDFREGLKVYFGETPVPQHQVRVVDYKTIIVTTPPHAPGRVEVKVENPDGELSNPGYFTYLSAPKIAAVVDPEDPTETQRIRNISVEGGETIKIKGSGFISGARVVFNPVIRPWREGEPVVGTLIYIDGEPYLLESGADGQAEVSDAETIRVVTPPGKVDTGGIIVINPDGGASDIYDLKFSLPSLVAPEGVRAELIYDRYIRITWDPVEGAEGYEIYVAIDETEMDFVGSTELTGFIYTKLEPNTRYRFRVQAVGRFASSPPSRMSNAVRTGRQVGPPDIDGGLADDTTFERQGDALRVTIGVEDYLKPTVIDINQQVYAGARRIVVSIPAKVIARPYSAEIRVLGKDFSMTLSPKAFETTKVLQHQEREDAGVRFEIAPHEGSLDLEGKTSLSPQYTLTAELFIGADTSRIEDFASSIEWVMEYDKVKADLRRLEDVALYRYDSYAGEWRHVSGRFSPSSTAVRASVHQAGRYAILGAR